MQEEWEISACPRNLSVDSRPNCNIQWPAGHWMLQFPAGSRRDGEQEQVAAQKKKGEPKFPQDQLILCCHVSSIDPGAKIRNLSGKTRGKDTSGHCSADRCQQKYGKQGTAKELQPPREVRLVDSARAGDGQARKDGTEQGDTAGSPQGSEEAACYGGLVTEADFWMAEKEGHQHIPRKDIPDGPG